MSQQAKDKMIELLTSCSPDCKSLKAVVGILGTIAEEDTDDHGDHKPQSTINDDVENGLTSNSVHAIISLKGPGLVVLPKGSLPDGRYQPLSQAIFRISEEGKALILSRHSRQEYEFGEVELKDGIIVLTIPLI